MAGGARRRLAACVAAGLFGAPAAVPADEGTANRTRTDGASADASRAAGAASDAVPGERSSRAAMAMIEAMSVALRTLNYEGTFVHLQGMHASSMHILHAHDGGGELERMVSLDGEAREVIRDHSLVTCIWPDSAEVIVSKSRPRKLLPDVEAILAGNPSYAFALAGTDRVAGLPTDVVEILPRDDFRYGYRFWVDRETRMLLRSMLLDGGKILEQVLFTAIEYPETIARARFAIDVGDAQVSWVEEADALPASARATAGEVPSFSLPTGEGRGGAGSFAELESRLGADEVDGDDGATARAGADGSTDIDRVRFENLPTGYAELSESYGTMPPGDAPVSHVMVSDGMASVSVYVEHVAEAVQDTSVVGLSSMGAMNAYGLSLERGFVTVVGEVPPDTVRTIAESVRLPE